MVDALRDARQERNSWPIHMTLESPDKSKIIHLGINHDGTFNFGHVGNPHGISVNIPPTKLYMHIPEGDWMVFPFLGLTYKHVFRFTLNHSQVLGRVQIYPSESNYYGRTIAKWIKDTYDKIREELEDENTPSPGFPENVSSAPIMADHNDEPIGQITEIKEDASGITAEATIFPPEHPLYIIRLANQSTYMARAYLHILDFAGPKKYFQVFGRTIKVYDKNPEITTDNPYHMIDVDKLEEYITRWANDYQEREIQSTNTHDLFVDLMEKYPQPPAMKEALGP